MKLLKNPVVLILIGFFITLVFVNIVLKEPPITSPVDELNFGKQLGDDSLVLDGAINALSLDPNNIDYNRDWLIAMHHTIVSSKGRFSPYFINNVVVSSFVDKTESGDSVADDVGHYGLGLYAYLNGQYGKALSELGQVKNQKLKYLNNSIGECELKLGLLTDAKRSFQREITNDGDLNDAYKNLFDLNLKEKDYSQIQNFLGNDEAYRYIDNKTLSEYYFLSNSPFKYLRTILLKIYLTANVYGLIGALMILACWIIFFRYVDIFEHEKWRYILITVAAGAIGGLFTFPLYDFDALKLGFNLNGGSVNDFFYSVFGTAIVQEIIKIIPLLLLIKFTKVVNEPVDYVIYACLSALGFAFVGNLLQFDSSHLLIINGSATTGTVAQMFFSAVIGYGMAQNKVYPRRSTTANFLLFFFFAVVAHGYYDYLYLRLNSDWALVFSVVLYIFTFFMISSFLNFINNTLNVSSFLKDDDDLNPSRLQDILVFCFGSIFLFQYVAISIKFGPAYGNEHMLTSLLQNIFIIVSFSTAMGGIDLYKGMWDNPFIPRFTRKPGLSFMINKRVGIFPKPFQNILTNVLPVSGTVVKRLIIDGKTDYLVVKLDLPLNIAWLIKHVQIHRPHFDYVIIKGQDRWKVLTLGFKQPVYFITLRQELDPMKDIIGKGDIDFIDWAFVK